MIRKISGDGRNSASGGNETDSSAKEEIPEDQTGKKDGQQGYKEHEDYDDTGLDEESDFKKDEDQDKEDEQS